MRELGSEKTAKVACLKSSRVDFELKVKVAQLFPTLFNPMDYTLRGILQAKILKRVAFHFSGDLPNPGIEHRSPPFQADSLPAKLSGKPEFWIGSPLMFFMRHKWRFKLIFITSGWSNSLNVTVLRLAIWSFWIHSGYKINIYEGLGHDEEKEWKGKVKKSKSGSSTWAVAEAKSRRMVSYDSTSWFMAQARHRERDGGVTSQQA